MRKKEKFYHFITGKFRHIFPKMKDYFKILNSEFFDEDWYKSTYNILDNTDCVIHYLLIGYSKGFNPGPNFDSLDYYSLNKDVESAKLNPLIHYEKFGRREGRRYKLSDEESKRLISYISDSLYFDEEWYLETYDLSKDLDLAKHYLKLGYKQGKNPGPYFSNDEYYECNLDVKRAKMNPLLHYEQYGREEYRIIHVSEIPKRNHYLISHSPFFDSDWYKNRYKLVEDINPADHYLNIGFKLGYNPGPDFDSSKYCKSHPNINMNPLLYYELYERYSGS